MPNDAVELSSAGRTRSASCGCRECGPASLSGYSCSERSFRNLLQPFRCDRINFGPHLLARSSCPCFPDDLLDKRCVTEMPETRLTCFPNMEAFIPGKSSCSCLPARSSGTLVPVSPNCRVAPARNSGSSSSTCVLRNVAPIRRY